MSFFFRRPRHGRGNQINTDAARVAVLLLGLCALVPRAIAGAWRAVLQGPGSRDLPFFSSFGAQENVATLDQLPPDRRSEQQRLGERGGVRGGKPSTAAGWKDYARTLTGSGQYGPAAEAFRRSAALYAAKGDPNAAKILETQAERYETQVALFTTRPADRDALRHRYYTGRRLEPVYGAYLGAFIDHEDGLTESFKGENGEEYRACQEFNRRTGKHHAIFFTYNGYTPGRPFPQTWFSHLKENGAAPQWVILPSRLDDVRDDAYLHGLARQARDAGIPVFVRFAGEMNGSWTPYHGNPERYKAAFQLVARVFHEEAPNAALVWCPNDVPEHEIDRYYPGEDAVDWVGVNFYSVYFNDNNPNRPVSWRNPADSLEYVYRKYAGRHPIMIGECAATHLSAADGVTRDDYAVDKIGQLYAALPRRFPRVKAINWFSMNAIKYAPPGRQFNDYSLLGDPKVTEQYRRMVSSPYFLEEVKAEGMAAASEEIAPLKSNAVLTGKVTLSAYVKTYEQRPEVTYTISGKPLATFHIPGEYAVVLDTTSLPDGPAHIAVEARDSQKRVAGRSTVTVTIRNKPSAGHDHAPAPAPPSPSALQTLTQAIGAATTAPSQVRIEPLVQGHTFGDGAQNEIPLGSKLRFRVSVGSGESGYLFLLLIDRSDDSVQVLAWPRRYGSGEMERTDATLEIPQDPRRALRPGTPGRFTVVALLTPSPGAASKLSQTVAGANTPGRTWQKLTAAWAVLKVPVGTVIYQARSEITIKDP